MNYAIILCGGLGTRFSDKVPKQFYKINDREMFLLCIDAFINSKVIDGIILVSNANHISLIKDLIKKEHYSIPIEVINGGKTRQESSYLGVKALDLFEVKEDDVILIHDASRPFVSSKIITDNIKDTEKFGAACTAVALTSSVMISNSGDVIDNYLDRNVVYTCQTPQSFKFKNIKKAHEVALLTNISNASDDAQLMRLIEKKVHIVNGDNKNIKVTFMADVKKY